MTENLIEVTERCRHSLMCRHVCPVGNLTRLETLTPHGWAQLIALERRGLSTWNAETVDALFACADCGSCRAHCVTSQALPEAIAAARADVVTRGLGPAVVYELEKRLRRFENPYDGRRPDPAAGTGDVALFVGDDAYFHKPAVLESVLTLLRPLGTDPVLIGRGRNTGYLASSLGLPEVARDLARANVDELEATGAARLLVLSPGHYFAFGQMYEERLDVGLPQGVEIQEVVAFLASSLDEGLLRLTRSEDGVAHAYVDPTHAVRVHGRGGAPRRLLEAAVSNAPVELFWRDGRAYPCGNLALEFTHPDLSEALTRERLADAARAGAEVVVTDGPGSLVHLERHAPAFGVHVRSLYDLLAERVAV